TDGIYNSGKQISAKKIQSKIEKVSGKKYHFNESDNMFIKEYKYKHINYLSDLLKSSIVDYIDYLCHKQISKKEFVDQLNLSYDEIIEYISREAISLFKIAQLIEYKNSGIDLVSINSDENFSCPICNSRSGRVVSVDDFINDIKSHDYLSHAFCKY